MAVNILPTDTITPALKDVFGQLSNINLAKIQEETRKRNELADLTAVSLQNVSANDNMYLQSEKDRFIKDASKAYGENNGYLPYNVQADLQSRKSSILMEAKASEEWKKRYQEVVEKMATSNDIDKNRTAENLKKMMVSASGEVVPPSQRPDPYAAVSLNFDTNEYLKKNLNLSTEKKSSFDPNDKHKIITTEDVSPERIYSQIVGFMDNPAFKAKIKEEAADAGYSDVDSYIKEKKVPMYARKSETFTKHWPSNVNNFFNAPGLKAPTAGQGIVVKIKNADGSGSTPYTYTPSQVFAVPPASVSLNGKDIILSNSVGKAITSPMDIEVQSAGYFPSVYSSTQKRWFIVPDEDKEKYANSDVQNRPWFVGTSQVGTGENRKEVITFVPITEERKKLVEAKLGTDAGKQPFKIGDMPGQFDEPTVAPVKKSSNDPIVLTTENMNQYKDGKVYTFKINGVVQKGKYDSGKGKFIPVK